MKTGKKIPDHDLPEPPTVHSVDWAKMVKRFSPLQKRSQIWLGVLILFAILIGVIYFIFNGNTEIAFESGDTENEMEAETETTDPNLVPDSLQVNFSESPTQEGEEAELAGNERLESLPDTLHLVIYAATDKLEPVRVYSDVMDETNPYWVEQGTALRFEFVDTMRIRGQYDRMILLMNGHVIGDFREEFYEPETRMLEIGRSYFEEDDRWLQPVDSISTDTIPPPDQVMDRPSFN